MNTKEITAIAIKFLAIWLLVQVILQVPSLLLVFSSIESYTQHGIAKSFYITVVGSFLIVGSIASYLLFRVANSVLNALPSSNNSDTNNVSQQFLLQLVGVYFIVAAIILMLGAATGLRSKISIELSTYLLLVGALFELAVGLYMLIKPKVWVHVFRKLRGRE